MLSRSLRFRNGVAVAAAIATLLAGCGDDDSSGTADTTTTSTTSTTTTAPSSSTSVVQLEQPAVWPAPDVVFATPEAAASDFITKGLGAEPVLGDFQAGDSRSGEMEVFSPGEGGGTQVVRSLLLLRQLGPDNGWFVIAAINEHASITTPEARVEVAAGPLDVAGVARGFEANVVVSGFQAGTTQVLDQIVTSGGSMETAEPYGVTLDLTGAQPGGTVVLMVRGGTGLEDDPGEFSAIPVIIEP